MDKLSEMRVEYFVSKRKKPCVKFVLCFCSLCPCLHVGVCVLNEMKTYTVCFAFLLLSQSLVLPHQNRSSFLSFWVIVPDLNCR